MASLIPPPKLSPPATRRETKNQTIRAPLSDSADTQRICDEYTNMMWNSEIKPFFNQNVAASIVTKGRSGPSRPSWERTQKRMGKCKLKHRSDFSLSDWYKYNHAQTKTETIMSGSDSNYPINPSIDRVRCNHLSTERFVRQYERTGTPVILTGCADHWSARANWTFEALLSKYGNTLFKCGEDDEGYKVKIKLKYFLEYVIKQQDDSPMYVFDNSFDEHPVAKALMQDILDLYKTGINITSVTMQNAQPPEQVQASFDDAVKAKQDLERQKNEGQAYANDIVPKATGTASRLIAEANGYKVSVENESLGNASRFTQILAEYLRAPEVTKNRLFLEAQEQIMSSVSKVIVDQKGSNSLLYLPLDKLINKTSGTLNKDLIDRSQASSEAINSNNSSRDVINSITERSRGAFRARDRDVR